ncbi:MAG: glycosyl hydrolase family 43 [Sphingobium sp.]|nr:glycosyl hydrolase family 43 [Sphingobium sp.]
MAGCAQGGDVPPPPAAPGAPAPRSVTITGNPILAEGDYYSADPAPFVADGALWILAGRDEAPADVNDFIMKEWQLLRTTDPASGKWTHYPRIASPGDVFAWAEKDRAYAGQIITGPDGRYYFYAPVMERNSDAKDRFAIGVAVADSPTGPWKDAHPSGPILSQRVPVANDIQNIDPTILIDDDGRVYIYWGTFGKILSMELERDMITPKGPVRPVEGLKGFFEAPWVLKRNGTYYMLYAANHAGPQSDCTPAVYHACIAYASAPDPMGPWTYRGVVLKPVSSTTSHPGAVEYKGRWYLAYHAADAKGGGHFRRNVALDPMEWDDSVSPAAIKVVTPTKRPSAPPVATRNIAMSASAAASNEPVPVQYWIKALNDGITKAAPLPPDLWGSWSPNNPPKQWIEYRWDEPVTINGARILFWADQPAGSAIGVAPPAAWRLEYWNKGWKPVPGGAGAGPVAGRFEEVGFSPLRTRCLRAVLTASGDGKSYAGMAVQEWEVLAPKAALPVKRSGDATAKACD